MGYKIYKYTFPNNKIYIGKTKNSIAHRAGANGCRYGKTTLVGRAIRKYGWENVNKEILYDDLSEVDANMLERCLIAIFNSTNAEVGYNMTYGGDGGVCCSKYRYKMSDEMKKKIGERSKRLLTGRKVPKEVLEKRSKALTGHIVTEETREKIRLANTGYKHTDEAKRKMSENNCMHSEEVRKKVSESLKKSGKDRARKRKFTIEQKYPGGLKQSEESNRKRSEALKGRPKSEETKQKMRKPKSPETIERMRQAQIEAWKRRKTHLMGGD